jgi:hypothetical protein
MIWPYDDDVKGVVLQKCINSRRLPVASAARVWEAGRDEPNRYPRELVTGCPRGAGSARSCRRSVSYPARRRLRRLWATLHRITDSPVLFPGVREQGLPAASRRCLSRAYPCLPSAPPWARHPPPRRRYRHASESERVARRLPIPIPTPTPRHARHEHAARGPCRRVLLAISTHDGARCNKCYTCIPGHLPSPAPTAGRFSNWKACTSRYAGGSKNWEAAAEAGVGNPTLATMAAPPRPRPGTPRHGPARMAGRGAPPYRPGVEGTPGGTARARTHAGGGQNPPPSRRSTNYFAYEAYEAYEACEPSAAVTVVGGSSRCRGRVLCRGAVMNFHNLRIVPHDGSPCCRRVLCRGRVPATAATLP